MPVTNAEIRKFRGVYLQKNSFNVPEGAMERATNVILEQDDRIVKLRGFYTYLEPEEGEVLNNLYLYKNTLMLAYDDNLSRVTESGDAPNTYGTATALTGKTIDLTNRVARFAEAGSNLYMTTNDGIVKIDSPMGKIFEAGSPSGLDLQATWSPAVTGFIPAIVVGGVVAHSSVAYRVLFGRRDGNSLEILGEPSDALVLVNSPIADVDYTSAVDTGGYKVTATSVNHQLVTGQVINVSGTTPDFNGDYSVTVVDADTFTFIVTPDPGIGKFDYNTSRNVTLEGSIPDDISDISDGYFIQIYRSSIGEATTVPDPDYRLIKEQALTEDEINAHLFTFTDEIISTLVEYQPQLYTNPSQEGEVQANLRPPKCADMTVFKNCLIYAGCTTRHYLQLNLVDSLAISGGDFVEVKIGEVIRRFVARSGVGNTTTSAEADVAGSTVTVYSEAHGLVVGDKIYITNAVGTGDLPFGEMTIGSATADEFTFTFSGATGLSSLSFQGVKDGSGYYMFTLRNDGSVAQNLSWTARHLVKAFNRDPDAPFYGRYTSGIRDTPGMMAIQAEDFGPPIYVRASSTTTGSAFFPALPDSFSSGTQVYSKNDDQPNIAYASKPSEPEAVPLANDIKVGEKNGSIVRVEALRDSVIFLKTDGIYRMTGDDPGNFDVTLLDGTIFCIAPSSVQVLNNQVYFLSNQGVCVVTESAASIISREQIEDEITPIIGKPNIATQTSAVAYESNRTYRLSTIGPNSTSMSKCHIFNFVNNTWTEQATLFKQGAIGPNDRLYLISTNGNLIKERKDHQKTDYCGQHHTGITVSAVDPGKRSATISSLDRVVSPGDILIKAGMISRIKAVKGLGGGSYAVTFRRATNLLAGDTVILYEGYRSTIVFAPFHAGQVGMMKKFSKLHIHTRSPSISKLSISFGGYTAGGSPVITWESDLIEQNAGWGNFPWGYKPWGETDSINLVTDTRSAVPIRTLVPAYQQRNTFLKVSLVHDEAGESLDIQALVLGVRPYQERVSK